MWIKYAICALVCALISTAGGARQAGPVAVLALAEYAALLGKGLDVDWAKTPRGQSAYHVQTVKDFKARGLSHVRIRVKDDLDRKRLAQLDTLINDCLAHGLIPVLAYQAGKFKQNPSDRNLDAVVDWWTTAAEHFKLSSPLLSFDLLIEATEALNKQPERLNVLYEKAVAAIRRTNPERIVILSPRLRSDPAYLHELKIPTAHNHRLMAEWHFYAAGPSKTNPNKRWTRGTPQEKQLILDKIRQAKEWEQRTGIPTWVGAWMPGNYNDGNDYSIAEQVVFARFVAGELDKAGIPYAVNSDTKFYDRQNNRWILEMQPVLDAILHPERMD